METITATEARKQFFHLIQEGKMIEISHPKNHMIMINKTDYNRLWQAMIIQEMDEALERAKGQKRYSTEELECMMAEILNTRENRG
ncbi:MAG: hypothetical protein HQM12_03255 [SAR324 cluster bacterium]|nr:hypothetical protein [SAR324 cluster bacterium]